MLIIWRFPGVRKAMQQAGEQEVGPTPRTVIADELPTLAGQHLTLRHLYAHDGEETLSYYYRRRDWSMHPLADRHGFRDAVRYARRRPAGHGEESGLQRLKGKAAEKLSLAQYSERCGVPEAQIIALAEIAYQSRT